MGDVVSLAQIDHTQVAIAGGKGALLGELTRTEGIPVPDGFCVTTRAFERIVAEAPAFTSGLDRLSTLTAEDQGGIRELSAQLRETIEQIPLPADLTAAIAHAVAGLGEDTGVAVRSSATAEDSTGASFAGQHDSYLNVSGAPSVAWHVSRCWASLFSERAVAYRLHRGLDQRSVRMAVVVQRMVVAQAAGVLFTADPVSSNRKTASVEAGAGLGDGLVSGRVNADVYTVHEDGDEATVATTIAPGRGEQPVLAEAQVRELVALGRRIEAHLGRPQDIEWCLADSGWQIVQSRPITTLFPIPTTGDAENHVYVSVGHQQMMTDAMKPLGLSFWQLTAMRPMPAAGGRLFVDVTRDLASTAGRATRLAALRRSDPLIGEALQTILDRGNFVPALSQEDEDPRAAAWKTLLGGPGAAPLEADPAIVTELIEASQASIATLSQVIRTHSGPALIDFIEADIQELRRSLFSPQSTQVIMAAMRASWWLNEQLEGWLGEKNAADVLTQSVPHNVTSEMGLALLDVADVIRPHAQAVAVLEHAVDDSFLERLLDVPGGQESLDAIRSFLERYGMRCAGEIDITRPRWSEQPITLVPLILGNIMNFAPGAGPKRFAQGRREALAKRRELLARLRTMSDGEQKASEAEEMIDRLRTFSGYREYPKYGMVSRYFVYKQALRREAERLVLAGALADPEDLFYLTFAELREAVSRRQVDHTLIAERAEAYRSYQALTPPRVLTSDGEVLNGRYQRDDVPPGALPGLAVSAGTVEGRARVIRDMADARLQPGDILVTAYTDPSWTPLFVAIGGLVTEVGGLMTHGAVIAREYGVPAVVAVERAAQLIADGQRIRVNGTDGYIEILG